MRDSKRVPTRVDGFHAVAIVPSNQVKFLLADWLWGQGWYVCIGWVPSSMPTESGQKKSRLLRGKLVR